METTADSPRTRTRPILLAVVAAAIAFLIGALLLTTQSSKAESPATLKVLKPAVSVRPNPSAPYTIVSGPTAVNQGASVRTDATGMAEIKYFDGSHTRLGVATEYDFTELARDAGGKQLVGKLDIGRSYHKVAAITGSSSRFQVKTSNATAAVRGTAFTVVCLVRGVCEITVIEGAVALLDPVTGQPLLGRDGRPVILQAGQAITVTTLPDGTILVSDVHPADLTDPFLVENAGLDDLSLVSPSVRGTSEDAGDGPTGSGGGGGGAAGGGGGGAAGGGAAPGGGADGATPASGDDGALPPGAPQQGGSPDSPRDDTGPPASTPPTTGGGTTTTTTQPGSTTTTTRPGTTPTTGPPGTAPPPPPSTTTTTTPPSTTTTCPGGGYPPRPC